MSDGNVQQATVERQRELASTLGVGGPGAGERLTVGRLREEVDAEPDEEFVSMGASIREDLSGTLDAALLTEELPEMATQLSRIEAVREAGIPASKTGSEVLYRDLIEPGWRVYHHLADVGFFESVEENLPAFTLDISGRPPASWRRLGRSRPP